MRDAKQPDDPDFKSVASERGTRGAAEPEDTNRFILGLRGTWIKLPGSA